MCPCEQILIYTLCFHLLYFLQVRNLNSSVSPSSWLEEQIKEYKTSLKSKPFVPMKGHEEHFEVSDLYEDQQFVCYKILDKIREFLLCKDFSTFRPLRCTINGQGGSGKTVLLNTITSVLR